MSTTGNALATRPNGAPAAAQQQSAALDLRAGQKMWTQDQHAALVAMGIPRQASSAELGVFLHQCQRTGLDPFSKQIYLIYRDSYEDGQKVKRPTTQVGIDGFRVIRDRIARRDKLRVEYEDTTWYDADRQPYDVWVDTEPPAACKLVVVVDGRRFPAVLSFNEYAQRKRDGALNKMWSEKPAHMIEKCCEAEGLRKAFPNDLAGVYLDDAMPLPDDAPPERPRVTGDDLRNRAQQQPQSVRHAEPVDAVIVDDEPPFPGDAQPARPQPQDPDGDPLDPRDEVLAQLRRLHCTAAPAIAIILTRLSGRTVASVESLTRGQAEWFAERLADIETPDELEAAAVAAEVRREEGTVPGADPA